MTWHAGVVAAAAVSNPFDLGAAWKRQAATFPFGLAFFFQYAVVLRCDSYPTRAFAHSPDCCSTGRILDPQALMHHTIHACVLCLLAERCLKRIIEMPIRRGIHKAQKDLLHLSFILRGCIFCNEEKVHRESAAAQQSKRISKHAEQVHPLCLAALGAAQAHPWHQLAAHCALPKYDVHGPGAVMQGAAQVSSTSILPTLFWPTNTSVSLCHVTTCNPGAYMQPDAPS